MDGPLLSQPKPVLVRPDRSSLSTRVTSIGSRASRGLDDIRLSYVHGLSSLTEPVNIEEDPDDSYERVADRIYELYRGSSYWPSLTALPILSDADKTEDKDPAGQKHDCATPSDHLVTWKGDDDPQNPQNWSKKKKWTQMVVISWICFVTPMATTMLAPAMPHVARDLHITSRPRLTFPVSVYTLGFAVGAVSLAPLSETYGRLPLYHVSNVFAAVFTLACALSKNYAALIAFRLLAGCLGSAALVLGSSTCVDMFSRGKRGNPMAALAFGTLVGPSLGPVIGSELVETLGWRWIFYLLASIAGANIVAAAVLLRETQSIFLLQRKAKRLRAATGNQHLHANSNPRSFSLTVMRPIRMLIFSPPTLAISLVSAVTYGILYLQITAIPFVFGPKYGFTTQQTGLIYLAPGAGAILALPLTGRLTDYLAARAKARGNYTPESARLSLIRSIPSTLIAIAGLLFFGWTAEYHIAWPVPLSGLLLFNFGLLFVVGGLQAYLLEQYPIYAASSSAATTFTRSIATGLLPLSGLDLYYAFGLGWANTLLAGLMVVGLGVLVLIRVYGARIRARVTKRF